MAKPGCGEGLPRCVQAEIGGLEFPNTQERALDPGDRSRNSVAAGQWAGLSQALTGLREE